ncbi:hypothetical protein OG806_49705 [Streptomyces sp. NBC_00882]|uniref:hypothetical protein n=1 Tax=Streptomyces sp. NBC_00882 TaxID=2975856 RepID=UPI00386EFB08|nr:hypothetical protein OG806_00240 [Streptomyces sp. NBC_00882]WSZ36893.1 hypothetical protein OG806_49705 [Streptomyces sp. NBC_00882]
MARDARDEARQRLAVLPENAAAHWAPARRLEQDAALLGRLLIAAAGQQGGGRAADVTVDDVGAALNLFEDMRHQLDRLESQVVLEARRRSMDWRQIAEHQGLNSSQAASQRYQRLMTRLEEIRQGVR